MVDDNVMELSEEELLRRINECYNASQYMLNTEEFSSRALLYSNILIYKKLKALEKKSLEVAI